MTVALAPCDGVSCGSARYPHAPCGADSAHAARLKIVREDSRVIAATEAHRAAGKRLADLGGWFSLTPGVQAAKDAQDKARADMDLAVSVAVTEARTLVPARLAAESP